MFQEKSYSRRRCTRNWSFRIYKNAETPKLITVVRKIISNYKGLNKTQFENHAFQRLSMYEYVLTNRPCCLLIVAHLKMVQCQWIMAQKYFIQQSINWNSPPIILISWRPPLLSAGWQKNTIVLLFFIICKLLYHDIACYLSATPKLPNYPSRSNEESGVKCPY